MKTLLVSIAAALACAAAPLAVAEKVADMKPPAKYFPNKKTMAKDGRFHYLHVKKEKMDCSDCHADESKDRFFLRSTEPPPATLTAHVNRAECLECHEGKKKPKWYGVKPE